MRRQVDVATMTISRSERRNDPQSILLRSQKREVFGLSTTYPLIEVLLKINRSNRHPSLEKNRPKANAKHTVSSFPKTGKQHLTLRPATHLPRSNHRLLWAATMHTSHFQGLLVDGHQLGDICLQLKLQSHYWRHHHSSGGPRPAGSRSCLQACTAFWPWSTNMLLILQTLTQKSKTNASCAKSSLKIVVDVDRISHMKS